MSIPRPDVGCVRPVRASCWAKITVEARLDGMWPDSDERTREAIDSILRASHHQRPVLFADDGFFR